MYDLGGNAKKKVAPRPFSPDRLNAAKDCVKGEEGESGQGRKEPPCLPDVVRSEVPNPVKEEIVIHRAEDLAMHRHHIRADEKEANHDEQRPDRRLQREKEVSHIVWTKATAKLSVLRRHGRLASYLKTHASFSSTAPPPHT